MNPVLDRLVGRMTLWQIDAVGAAACVLLGGLWYVAGVGPLAQARAEHREMSKTLAQKQEEAAKLASDEREFARALARVNAEMEKVTIRLLPADQINSRLGALTGLAQQAGLTLNEIKPGAPGPAAQFTPVPIRISGTGSFGGVAAFLHLLRERFPDTGVARFDLRGDPEGIDRPAGYSVDMVWYAAPSATPKKKP
jgi:hypothetical protein